MEVGFSSDTTAPAEQVHVLSGILLSALVCLTLMSDAGAERFALVGSACFLCLFLLGIRREVKATVLGGPWRSLRSLCYSSEVFSCMGWCFGYFGLTLIQVTHAGFSTAGLSGSKGGSTKMKKLLCWIRRVHSLCSSGLVWVSSVNWWRGETSNETQSCATHPLWNRRENIFIALSFTHSFYFKSSEWFTAVSGHCEWCSLLTCPHSPTVPWPFLWAFSYHTQYQQMKCYENFANSSQMGGRS